MQLLKFRRMLKMLCLSPTSHIPNTDQIHIASGRMVNRTFPFFQKSLQQPSPENLRTSHSLRQKDYPGTSGIANDNQALQLLLCVPKNQIIKFKNCRCFYLLIFTYNFKLLGKKRAYAPYKKTKSKKQNKQNQMKQTRVTKVKSERVLSPLPYSHTETEGSWVVKNRDGAGKQIEPRNPARLSY